MNPDDLLSFNQAIQLAQTGQKKEAYQQLKSLELTNPYDQNLILWLVFTAHSVVGSETHLERLTELNPLHPNLAIARKWIIDRRAKLMPNNSQKPKPSQFNLFSVIGISIVIVLLFLLFIQTPLGSGVREFIEGFFRGITK